MLIKKWIATGLSALMTGTTIAGGVLAAADLSGFPGNVASVADDVSSLDAFIVIGDDAKAEDVAGAVDVAARLAEQSFETKAVPGAAADTVDGVQKDTIGLNSAISTVIPNPVKNFHYSGLADTEFAWYQDKYDYSEQINLGTVAMSNDFGTEYINGTETMVINSGVLAYEYVFDETFKGTGSATSLNYTYPVKVSILGEEFQIVGVGSNSVVMLTGTTGTVKKVAGVHTPITHGDYTVQIAQASDGSWAEFDVVDADGVTVDTITATSEGGVATSSITNIDIRALDIRVSGTDPTTQSISVDVVVGKSG
jgi:hypothetical protein